MSNNARSKQFLPLLEKEDGTMRKLIDVSKLHSLGWTHKVEIENGVRKLFDWYRGSLN